MQQCLHEISPGSWHVDPEPPERCGEDAIEGTDYCTDHQHPGDEPDPDAAFEAEREERYLARPRPTHHTSRSEP